MTKKKLVIVSRSFPPLVIGSPVLLANLFSEYKGPLSAIAGWQYGAKVDNQFKPPCKTHYLKMPSQLAQRFFDRFAFKFIPFTKWYIKRKLKFEKADVVLGVCPSGEFFIAAYLACLELNIPFLAHMHDLWEENISPDTKRKIMAMQWEPKILQKAHTVFCMTLVQQKHYSLKYGIQTQLLPHTILPSKIEQAQSFDEKKINNQKIKIIYTGNVSRLMNLDAVRQFVHAVPLLPENYEVKMFVSFSEEYCKEIGLYHPKIQYDWLPMDKVLQEMKDANVLFLPLSFKNAAMDEVRTVFATKTLDYLISGTPILVFSPEDSFHSISANENGWGYVVGEDSPEELAAGIVKLCEDKNLAAETVRKALIEAESRSSDRYAENLYNYVQGI